MELTLTMTPSPVARKYGAAARITFHAPTTLTLRTGSQTSLLEASSSPCAITSAVPVMLTRMSRRPWRSMVVATRRAASRASPTSAGT
jgi:hypothetical protein